MMALSVVFWAFVILFGIIGAMRGWAKETLVFFAMVLALFLNTVIETYIGGVRDALAAQPPFSQFAIRAGLFVALAFFGYQTPHLPGLEGKFARDKLQDVLLGLVLGMVNGYMIIGTLWHFLHVTGYPLASVQPPPPDDVRTLAYVHYLPPNMLGVPYIFFAVGAAFVFVIVVFL